MASKGRIGSFRHDHFWRDHNDWEIFKRKLFALFHVQYLFKLVIVEVALFLCLYYIINVVYRLALDEQQRDNFEAVVKYFRANLDSINRDLTFLLGFYVTLVAKRWWDQYRYLPWPDDLCLSLNCFFCSSSPSATASRATIARYSLLSYVLCIRRFSVSLKKHLPTIQSITDTGLLREDEIQRLNIHDFSEDKHELLASNWWLPLTWATTLLKFSKQKEEVIGDMKPVIQEIINFRKGLEAAESHVHVGIPIVYKVVVFTAILLYFAFSLVGYQITSDDFDLYFPIFIVFKLIFFVGWYKVAQAIDEPFGEDDTDFEMYSLLLRHIRTTSVILHQYDDVPPMSVSGVPVPVMAKPANSNSPTAVTNGNVVNVAALRHYPSQDSSNNSY